MSHHPTVEDLISLQDAAQSSGLSQGHRAHLIRSGDLWGIKIGRNWVTTKQAIQDYQVHITWRRKRHPTMKHFSLEFKSDQLAELQLL